MLQSASLSHLTAVDAVFEGLSEGLTFEDCKGRVLQWMQTLNWDTAYVFHHRLFALSRSHDLTNPASLQGNYIHTFIHSYLVYWSSPFWRYTITIGLQNGIVSTKAN